MIKSYWNKQVQNTRHKLILLNGNPLMFHYGICNEHHSNVYISTYRSGHLNDSKQYILNILKFSAEVLKTALPWMPHVIIVSAVKETTTSA